MRKAAALLVIALCGCDGGRDARSPPTPVPHRTEVAPDTIRAPASLQRELDRLALTVDGPVGISVRDLDEGWDAEAGTPRALPQQSVSKLWVALAVYDAIDRGGLSLGQPVVLTSSDRTLFHQPLAALIGRQGYRISVADLLERAITQSDNTANDRLLRLVGGPDEVRRTLRRKGIDGISFGPGERMLQAGTAGLAWIQAFQQGGFETARSALPAGVRRAAYNRYVANPPDGAGAAALTMALGRLRRGDLLSFPSSVRMLATMSRTRTGRARLRAGLPAGWRIAHKTGTGQTCSGRTAGFNDVGILVAPDGHAYAAAVMIGDTSAPDRRRQALISGVARAVAAAHQARHPAVTPWTGTTPATLAGTGGAS